MATRKRRRGLGKLIEDLQRIEEIAKSWRGELERAAKDARKRSTVRPPVSGSDCPPPVHDDVIVRPPVSGSDCPPPIHGGGKRPKKK